jgi:hypothetical protein
VGLLGNPSDVYGGRALSFTIADFSATVRLRPSPQLLIQPHPHHDLVAFPSLPQLVSTALLPSYPIPNPFNYLNNKSKRKKYVQRQTILLKHQGISLFSFRATMASDCQPEHYIYFCLGESFAK